MKHVESLKRAHATRVDAAKAEAEQVAQRLTASPITVAAHAGEEGRLFGSVTPSDVAEAIEAQTGVRVDRHDVHMDEPIRSVGVHEVSVHLFAEVDPIDLGRGDAFRGVGRIPTSAVALRSGFGPGCSSSHAQVVQTFEGFGPLDDARAEPLARCRSLDAPAMDAATDEDVARVGAPIGLHLPGGDVNRAAESSDGRR